MNTHDPADVREGDSAQQRVSNANLYVKIYNELTATGAPVFLTGDFNNRYSLGGGNGPLGGIRDNLTYCILTANDKIWDAWDAAQNKAGKCPSDGAGPAKNAVDHIFLSKQDNVTAANFGISPSGQGNNGSDTHDTIFVDITIGATESATDPTLDSGSFIAGAYNILHEGWNKNIEPRAETVAKVINGSQTNGVPFGVTSIEEVSPKQYDLLKKKLPDYQLFPSQVPDRQGVAVMWNTKQFKLVDSGYVSGTYSNGGTIANESKPWVKLQNSAGKIVYYLAIHSPNNTEGTSAMRIQNAEKFLAWAKSKISGKDLVMIAGDFNRSGNTEYDGGNGSPVVQRGNVGAYCTLTDGAVLQHASDMAKGVEASKKCPSGASAIPIDQIYLSLNAGASATGWKHFGQGYLSTTGTDHSPALVTVKLGN